MGLAPMTLRRPRHLQQHSPMGGDPLILHAYTSVNSVGINGQESTDLLATMGVLPLPVVVPVHVKALIRCFLGLEHGGLYKKVHTTCRRLSALWV